MPDELPQHPSARSAARFIGVYADPDVKRALKEYAARDRSLNGSMSRAALIFIEDGLRRSGFLEQPDTEE